ncbi:MAG: hypothetical protein ACWA41_10720 [Putridiphycobacter sp.]
MILLLKIIGILLMGLGLIHVIFPVYFDWKTELPKLSLINRQVFKIHTFFIALIVFLMGALSFFYAEELINSPLGKIIALGFAIFWSFRLYFQFFGYSAELWKGKTFETIIHIIFSLMWIAISSVFWWIYFS